MTGRRGACRYRTWRRSCSPTTTLLPSSSSIVVWTVRNVMDLPHPEAALRGSIPPPGKLEKTPQQPSQPQWTSQPQDDSPSSKDTRPDAYSNGEQDSLKAWAGIEGEMKKDDEGTMEGHIKDVDTLLVFAGLFSAVLTAFAVESYKQLQPDNDEISTNLLRRISIQLESFTLSSGFANSTLPAPPLPSADFTAGTTARWINILWFLSLIFSLAAALFGIFVKQWIREYMQWNAALAQPRDNVLVRQIRYEAWHDWNVPATIAAVPALLEIALVLFVCGLVILLWTLDPVVSIVITTAAAVFLAIAATFTFLPAFFRRCPYKSPTAWAIAVFWDFLTRYIPHKLFLPLQQSVGHWIYNAWSSKRTEHLGEWLMKTSGQGDTHPRIGNWTAFAHDWRSRDLANLWASLWPGTERGDAVPLLEELRLERAGPPINLHVPYKYRDSLPALLHGAQRTISELSPLVRALAWVSKASQDTRTQAYVLSCVESLETRFTLPHDLKANDDVIPDFLDEDGVHAVSHWTLALDVMRRGARSTGTKPVADEQRNTAALLAQFSPPAEPVFVHWAVAFDGPSPEIRAFAHLLALSVRTLSRTLSSPPASSEVLDGLRSRNVLRLRRYLAVLGYFIFPCMLHMPDVADYLHDTFVEMINKESRSHMSLFPDWQETIVGILAGHDSRKLKKLMDELETEGWPTSPENVSRITRALISRHANTSQPQGIHARPAAQGPRKAICRTAEPTDDPPQTPPTNVVLRPTSTLRLQRRSVSFPPTARPSLQQSSRRWSLNLPESPRLLTRALGDLERAEASGSGALSQPSVVPVENEQGILNDLVGTSSSRPGSRELANGSARSSNARGPSAEAPSSLRTVCPSSPPPFHSLPSKEPPPRPFDAAAEEERKERGAATNTPGAGA